MSTASVDKPYVTHPIINICCLDVGFGRTGLGTPPSEEVSVIPLKIKTFIVRLALVIHRQLWSIIKESHSCPKLLKKVKKNK